MFRSSDSEVNADQLMHQIRQSVARRREPAVHQSESSLSLRTALPISVNNYTPLRLQPEFHADPNGEYHVADFLEHHGPAFVRNAYLGLLKREPDPEGSELYLQGLASGKLNKLDVLARLYYSEEGRNSGVKLTGLAGTAFIRRLERLPLIGYLVGLIVAVTRLPNLHRHVRESEFHVLAQQELIVDHYDRAHRQLVQTLQQVLAIQTEETAGHQRNIDLLLRQQREFAQQQVELRETISAVRQEADSGFSALSATQKHFENRSIILEQQATTLRDYLETQLQSLIRRQEEISGDVARQKKNHSSLLKELREQLRSLSISLPDPEGEGRLDELYASFEDQFRGARAEIKARLEVYLPILRKAGMTSGLLDIGCGRGEWLELLRDAGIEGYGVDHNSIFIERCRQMDLNVLRTDAIAHLQGLPDASLALVTGFHIVEHISFDELITLLDEIRRTLKPGGGVILETPNPENFMVGSHTFYTDPTHRNPIPSTTLKFLLESRGFGRIEVIKLREWEAAKIRGDSELVKRFNEYFYSAPDYAVVGWKL